MRRLLVPAAVAAALLGFVSPSAFAQITSYEIDRGLNPNGGASRWIPYDGAPFSHKYNYNLGAGIIYFNGSASQMYYLDYLDKLDRAQRFGYAPPRPPFAPVVVQHAAPVVPVVPEAPMPSEVVVPEPEVVEVYPEATGRGVLNFGRFRRR